MSFRVSLKLKHRPFRQWISKSSIDGGSIVSLAHSTAFTLTAYATGLRTLNPPAIKHFSSPSWDQIATGLRYRFAPNEWTMRPSMVPPATSSTSRRRNSTGGYSYTSSPPSPLPPVEPPPDPISTPKTFFNKFSARFQPSILATY